MIDDFLRDLARRPFVWGQTDCALVIGEWWAINHGFDPAAYLRGSYASEDECVAVLKAEGQLPRLVARLARNVGARRVAEAAPGDFAVVRVADRWWGALRSGSGRWGVKSQDGLCAVDPSLVRVVAAWSVTCPRL